MERMIQMVRSKGAASFGRYKRLPHVPENVNKVEQLPTENVILKSREMGHAPSRPFFPYDGSVKTAKTKKEEALQHYQYEQELVQFNKEA